jgi:hypothetical protein
LKAVLDVFNLTNNERVLFVDQFNQLSGGNANVDFNRPRVNGRFGGRGASFQRPVTTRIAIRLEF